MKKYTSRFFAIALCFLFVFISGCGHSREVNIYRKSAHAFHEDGWFYVFTREGLIDEDADDSHLQKYIFRGINLRYRFDDDYIEVVQQQAKDKVITQRIAPGILLLGAGAEEEKHDMEIIYSILEEARNKGDAYLLGLDPTDYHFDTIDKETFFQLMREALSKEPKQQGPHDSYWDVPEYAMLCEPHYLNGYKFQIGFVNEMATVDGLYIDVLYETGDEYKDYVQLSDLVETNKATTEQSQAFKEIQEIVEGVKKNDSFIYGANDYKDKIIADIDFSRLYSFLNDLHNVKLERYNDGVPVTLN